MEKHSSQYAFQDDAGAGCGYNSSNRRKTRITIGTASYGIKIGCNKNGVESITDSPE